MDETEAPALAPGLYLIGTPIGNLEDTTLRALRILGGLDVLACEDTRVTRKLFQRYGLSAPKTILAVNDHNERSAAKRLAEYALAGKAVGFCSDAGMPGVSDPGFTLVREAREAGVRVEVVPGPSAVTAAIAVSGVPSASFVFLGFPPRRDGRFRRVLEEYAAVRAALVFYESPRRLGRFFAMAADVLGGERRGAACLELTKRYERVVRGGLAGLAERFGGEETRGEAVIVIEGAGDTADVGFGE